MKISPIEIRQQEFSKKMRGYDPDEVQNFLESLAEELDKLNTENESLKSEAESLTEQINEYKKIEQNLIREKDRKALKNIDPYKAIVESE